MTNNRNLHMLDRCSLGRLGRYWHRITYFATHSCYRKGLLLRSNNRLWLMDSSHPVVHWQSGVSTDVELLPFLRRKWDRAEMYCGCQVVQVHY